ncbi:nucleotidyl transferase AbiEii/AbiGii toxin family protein [Thalassospira sp.]|uniref:nucleotidyl transferase AbiEii/AbiGii toxin family protein n=1 Tax=Thalassospira sp. TaxID=1912094 RepID=UPI003AA81AF7
MSDHENLIVDIAEWVDRVSADPVAHLERQATEVLLTALGKTPSIGDRVYLKGGILMGVVYRSIRSTSDIDFTTDLIPDVSLPALIRKELNDAFPRATADIGYPDLLFNVQTLKVRPSPAGLLSAMFPALEIKVGYALRGTPQEKRFLAGKSVDVLSVDISFNEPIGAIQLVRLSGDTNASIHAYSLNDIISEKIRALLQQIKRNRNRRQDVYDLNLLISRFEFSDQEKAELLNVLLVKCHAREITPDQLALENPEIAERARAEWRSLALEIGELPDFDNCFATINRFYKSLPWD